MPLPILLTYGIIITCRIPAGGVRELTLPPFGRIRKERNCRASIDWTAEGGRLHVFSYLRSVI